MNEHFYEFPLEPDYDLKLGRLHTFGNNDGVAIFCTFLEWPTSAANDGAST